MDIYVHESLLTLMCIILAHREIKWNRKIVWLNHSNESRLSYSESDTWSEYNEKAFVTHYASVSVYLCMFLTVSHSDVHLLYDILLVFFSINNNSTNKVRRKLIRTNNSPYAFLLKHTCRFRRKRETVPTVRTHR